MNAKLIFICLLSGAAAVLTSGCLVKRTVTVNGESQQEGYAIKRPIKEAVENSQ